MLRAEVGMRLQYKYDSNLKREHKAMYALKLYFVSSSILYSQCGMPTFLAARHTTVCLDIAQ